MSTPDAWIRYAQRTLEREQGRDKRPVLERVDVTEFGDKEPQFIEVWKDNPDE